MGLTVLHVLRHNKQPATSKRGITLYYDKPGSITYKLQGCGESRNLCFSFLTCRMERKTVLIPQGGGEDGKD